MKTMNNKLAVCAVIGSVAGAPAVFADHRHGGLDECLAAASAIKDGWYNKLEYLTVTAAGVRTYEIEIQDPDGVQWELMCNVESGTIYEVEREVKDANDPLFKKHAKVDEETARNAALEIYAGTAVHTEYEIEANGAAAYEFDIAGRKGATFKVEVDAATGNITEVAVEKWDIGREADEH
jgi:uncharacterized membrane protein YkoI